MSKRILLIGGNGFLGKYLQTALKKTGYFTVSAPNHTKLDILNPKQMKVWVQDADIVINLTGQITQPIEDCLLQNSEGIRNLATACLQSGAFLVELSSALTVGPYAESKHFAEKSIQSILPLNKYLIIRLTNLYGVGQTKGLFWHLQEAFKKGQLEIKDNDGTLRRNFLHVEDAARIITQLIKSNAHGVFCVASPEYFSIRELVALIEKITKTKLPASYARTAPRENTDQVDIHLLTEAIDLSFAHTVYQCFAEFFADYEQSHSHHPST